MKWKDATDEDVKATTKVPVLEAKGIADRCKKRIVIVTSFDENCVMVVTTFGKDPEDKLQAAKLGEIVGQSIGAMERSEPHEDFRLVDQYAAIGKAAVDYAADTGECLFCNCGSVVAMSSASSETRTRTVDRHDDECPVGQILSRAKAGG
jgi:hypothetical protein